MTPLIVLSCLTIPFRELSWMDVREFMHILRNDPYTRKYNPKFVFSNELPAKILPNRYDFNDSTHFQI